ncbi:unnamed protein product [Cladocopium goreaui]|uniref:Uncharacterized protein n=1 Tax=Cladocopium goreaui TaxID=2562237 RepID=A0A9P1GMY2_9DINO|nr:unnamed protein product [Cladocopium goreaui]
MKARPKSLALAKFQQAGQLTIAKNKQTKAESKKDKGIDVIQVGSIASAAFLVLWIIASTMVSAVFTVRYMGIVEEDQAWYLLEGSARTAAAEAKAVMATAMQAKSDLIAAIDHGLIKTSYDYAAIESTLVPTMALKPYVHSFEMIFTDRQAGLKIGHREEENGRQLLLQSNGADCYLLGTQGCADLGVPQNKFPAWQAEAMYLNLSFTGDSTQKKRLNLDFCVEAMGEEAAQLIINAFVDGLAKGRNLPLLLEHSKSGVTSTVQMDKARTALSIRANGRVQRVPFESIMQISVGAEKAVDFDLPLHDLCVALLLEDEQTIYAFEFEDDEAQLRRHWMLDHSCHRQAEEPPPLIESGPPAALPSVPRQVPSRPKSVPLDPMGYPQSSARGVPGQEAYQDTGEASARSTSSKKELSDGQKIVKRFVQKMVRGRELKMLSTTGRSLRCLVVLDRDIRHISIQLAGKKDAKQRFVNLKSIEQIYVGQDVAEIELVTELSVTFVLEGGQAIAFDLDDEEERDTFAMCMQMFVDANRKDAERRRKEVTKMPRGSEAEIISQAQMIAIGKQAGPAEQWLFPPVLDAVQGSGENVTWYPIVRLIFRQPLPAAWAPQQEILCGRISLQVAALSKDHLRDSQLGDSGKTFLVDASGTILSAVQIQDTLAVDSVGAMQMRRLTDLPDASWSGSIAGAFRGDRIDAMQVKEGWLAVVVYPLPMPLNMFAIVVVSQAENSSFQDSSIFQSMIVLMAFTSVPYVVVFVTLSVVFFSANTKVGQEMKARKSVFARFAEGVTDFAAAQGVKMKHRNTVRPMSKGSDGPLFTKEMEGMGRKISQTSVLSAGEIYDAEDKPLAVQPRKTHIMNDAYFEADRSCKGYCVRCVRCFCACCRGRAGY